MTRRFTPDKDFLGNHKSLDRLDAAIQKFIKRDPKLKEEYEEEKLKLKREGEKYEQELNRHKL